MTNDYMFRAVLQKNNFVLRGLIAALLHLSDDEILRVEITNPIVLGDAVTKKEFRLDVFVVLNNHTRINLEMQVANELNWRNRSIAYLSRSYDQINSGENYVTIKPIIHIGFLNFSLENKIPEFYATYKLINVKNSEIYNDNFILSVVDLNQIDLATNEDKAYHIDKWAALFKASTWEVVKMLAQDNKYIKEASKTIFQLSSDEMIRKRCRDREEYYIDLQSYELKHQEDMATIKEKEAVLAKKQLELDEANSKNELLSSEIEQLSSEKQGLSSEIEQLSSEKQELSSENEQLSNENKQLLDKTQHFLSLLLQHGISPDA